MLFPQRPVLGGLHLGQPRHGSLEGERLLVAGEDVRARILRILGDLEVVHQHPVLVRGVNVVGLFVRKEELVRNVRGDDELEWNL